MESIREATDKLVVERDGKFESLPCERVRLDYPEQQGRGEAYMGRTQGGVVYAAIAANIGSGGGWIKSSQRLCRSDDGGRSWITWPLEFPGGTKVVAFTVLNDDNLLAAGGGDGNSCIFMYRSSDQGKTWKQAGVIQASPFEQMGEGALSLTQLKDGTVLFPVSLWNKPSQGTLQSFPQYVFRSIDRGMTWQVGDELKDVNVTPVGSGPESRWPGIGGTFPGCCETSIVELKNGNLLAAFRYSGHPLPWHKDKVKEWGGNPKPDNAARLFKNVLLGDSFDSGRTWENLRPLFDAEGRALLIFGECHGGLVELPDGRVVLVHDRRYPYDKMKSIGRISENGGKTWSRSAYHVSAGCGYPASVVLEDGTIVTVTGSTRYDTQPIPIEPWSVHAVRWRPE